jgi:hypothetical protein
LPWFPTGLISGNLLQIHLIRASKEYFPEFYLVAATRASLARSLFIWTPISSIIKTNSYDLGICSEHSFSVSSDMEAFGFLTRASATKACKNKFLTLSKLVLMPFKLGREDYTGVGKAVDQLL